MEKQILQGVAPEERIIQLRDSADKVQEFSYSRELGIGEVQELQSSLSQDLIAVDCEDQKLKMAKEIHKAATKPVKQEISSKLQKIRSGVEEVKEDVYLLKDVEDNKMGYYSKDGNLVFERALRPDEQQFSINEHLRKAQ
ncbi:hypothetical protein [Flavobacterium johnsoniae]|uniref:Uncharacterized protein n=1 Tax=Flavobacterium johnsoniae TaxID=986 RepID=A0A1M5IKI0_FLAJO|nr:hypothetical protein [Flavobacterium johnsoniae]SHG28430.1 hypothetical protein SAMN05444388_102129 [Flavobacterium johnsoniae]